MRILISTTHGTGHLMPLIPFARSLLRRGHEVRVSAPHSVRRDLAGAGLDHAPVDHPGAGQSRHILARLVTLPHEEWFRFAVRARFVGQNATMALPKVQETIRTWKPHLVLRDSCEYASALAAESAGIPHARVEVLNPEAEAAFTAAAAEPLDLLRERHRLKPDGGALLRGGLAFSAFPPTFFEASTRPIGSRPFLVRDTGSALAQPSTGAAWMHRDDRPLIYITFGTVLGELTQAFRAYRSVYRAALRAMADLPVRVLLTTGPQLDIAVLGAIPDNVTVETFVPQTQIFPHAAVVLNHGGSGTVLGSLAAGLPMVIVPLFADQPQNARYVEQSGAGVAVTTPNAASMRSAVEWVLTTPATRHAAGRVAAEIAALPDIETATDKLLALA